ncbi:hypothetical protein PUMCH_003866 [Australozyma saopauloensis]|uniref:RRM domain-containing protein n=1 Tax=Australozyma saopauloensis TaxID=291208 RepID=A0AAX4HDM0_9ASCO|nr:hypothetical protein PUMCH_003866 [[Candida] saopauloensis]
MASLTELRESKKEKRERKKEKKEKLKKPVEASEVDSADPVSDVVDSEPENVETRAETAATNEDSDNAESTETKGDELEIDLNLSAPLSKKKQRQLKKGKLDLEKIARKNPPPKPANEDGTEPAPSKKSPFGVWIGNLAYQTTREDIIKHIVDRTLANEEPLVAVTEADITRVNLPKKANKIKGFAYVDLPSAKHVEAVVALSESRIHDRNLLIKNASSFEGRPEEHKTKPLLKNPPSRILFVGNLSFDTTDDLLDEHFRPYGELVRIRMATFEDTGKCKGFAFLDFKDETGPTAALKSKMAKTFINRNLRLEYGEDRSKRTPKRQFADADFSLQTEFSAPSFKERTSETESAPVPKFAHKERSAAPKRGRDLYNDAPNKRMKSSVALATAQRASAAIVPSQGKKVTFD